MKMYGQKKVAVIQDMCGFGRCSMSVALPIISAFGIQACPVPTALFSNHTAFDSFYRDDLTDKISDYVKPWRDLELEFDGIVSGYLANASQVEQVIEFVRSFKKDNTILVVDPVMGDNGKLYKCIDSVMTDRMRELVEVADIVTPNVTECCAITGRDYSENLTVHEIKDMAQQILGMGPRYVVVTGIPMKSFIGNMCVEKNSINIIKRRKTGDTRCGTGDAFTAMLASLMLSGVDFVNAVKNTSLFIAKAIRKSDELGIDKKNGIAFEKFMKLKI